jgi:hypothetical protein
MALKFEGRSSQGQQPDGVGSKIRGGPWEVVQLS